MLLTLLPFFMVINYCAVADPGFDIRGVGGGLDFVNGKGVFINVILIYNIKVAV